MAFPVPRRSTADGFYFYNAVRGPRGHPLAQEKMGPLPQHSSAEFIKKLIIEFVKTLDGILPETASKLYTDRNINAADDGELAAMADDLIKELAVFRGRLPSPRILPFQDDLAAHAMRNIGEAVITIDAGGRVMFFNDAAGKLTGWSFEEARGIPVEKIVDVCGENGNSGLLAELFGACGTSQERKAEMSFIVKARPIGPLTGVEQTVACRGYGIVEKGRPAGTVLVFRDITQTHLMEEEILKIRKLESIGVLAGGIAHDFNNILTGITTYLFMAKVSVNGNSEAAMLIGEAEKAAFKATTLTKQLLSFSKGGPSIREITSVKPLIQDTVGFSLSGSNVDYKLEIDDDVAQVKVDKGQIDQALNCVLVNAVQAMPGGGTVTIGADNYIVEEKNAGDVIMKPLPIPAGRYVRISIEDEGVGIPRENLEHLFDPYFTTKKECAGLGLTTAYSIIKKHGGHIYVESTEGRGSLFALFLPALNVTNGMASGTEPPEYKGAGKILIMDDDIIVRTVVQTLLKKAGYSPVCTANGKDALERYVDALTKKDPFIVTIMDLTIPGGMGGKETVKKLREIDQAAKVIVFSGYSNDAIITNYREYGFNGVLSKPFSIDEFMQTIATVLLPPSGPAESGK